MGSLADTNENNNGTIVARVDHLSASVSNFYEMFLANREQNLKFNSTLKLLSNRNINDKYYSQLNYKVSFINIHFYKTNYMYKINKQL